ncbi:hypothetical protein RIR_jg6589.t1 [Rhizophagus irregularis DAOM 181602=DAOM 197198]|nr:hypothetical protein RIR_jg6589.t1 [Rhizophagus irregularis DAOM 181602=DAOM 197198]
MRLIYYLLPVTFVVKSQSLRSKQSFESKESFSTDHKRLYIGSKVVQIENCKSSQLYSGGKITIRKIKAIIVNINKIARTRKIKLRNKNKTM